MGPHKSVNSPAVCLISTPLTYTQSYPFLSFKDTGTVHIEGNLVLHGRYLATFVRLALNTEINN